MVNLKGIAFAQPQIVTRQALLAHIAMAFDEIRKSKMSQVRNVVSQWKKRLHICDEIVGANVDPSSRNVTTVEA